MPGFCSERWSPDPWNALVLGIPLLTCSFGPTGRVYNVTYGGGFGLCLSVLISRGTEDHRYYPTSVEVGGQWSTPGAAEDGAPIKTLGTKAQASFPSSQYSVCHHNHIWEEVTPSMTSLEQDSGNSTLGPLLDYAPCTISLGWFYLFTGDCPYLWILHLRTQPTSDVLYSGKKKIHKVP